MTSPLNPAMAPTVTYEYLFYQLLSDRLQPPARWKAHGLLLGSSTPGTTCRRLRPKILDMIGSFQQQMTPG
jgi:hypothetical protein